MDVIGVFIKIIMKKSTLDTWKKLQKEGYFEKHVLYQNRPVGLPHCVDVEDILGKNVVEIGCGYGRDTIMFSEFAEVTYAVDVSDDILQKMVDHVTNQREYYPTIIPVLAEDYKELIPNNIDYVYALHVIQHLTIEQTKDYIETFYEKLKVGGKINFQFYIGTDKIIEEGKEPKVCYQKKEALGVFKKYKIEKTWTLEKFDAKGKLQYEHFYVIAKKYENKTM